MHAACDFLADASNGSVVDAAWTQAARADGISQVRVALAADAAGQLPWGLFAQGLAAWKAAGVATDVLCSFEYMPPFNGHYPNEPVGTGTHRLTTAYAERFRLTLEAHAPQLIAAGAGGFIIWNEAQINLVAQGDNCPPQTRLNPDGTTRPDPTLNRSSLAPEAYATLLWQSCHSLEHIGCQRRIAGALSVLPQTGLDLANPYLLGFLGKVYAHLKACGVKPNWTHLALNMEGYWTVQTAQRAHDTIRAFMAAHGDSAELIVTEWGVKNKGMDAARLLETGAALEAVFGYAAFFCRPGQMPYIDAADAYTDWGARQWLQRGKTFQLATWYPAGEALRPFWAT